MCVCLFCVPVLQDGLYPLLLQLIDAASGSQDIANMALDLLSVLPTHSALSERLAAALDGPGAGPGSHREGLC